MESLNSQDSLSKCKCWIHLHVLRCLRLSLWHFVLGTVKKCLSWWARGVGRDKCQHHRLFCVSIKDFVLCCYLLWSQLCIFELLCLPWRNVSLLIRNSAKKTNTLNRLHCLISDTRIFISARYLVISFLCVICVIVQIFNLTIRARHLPRNRYMSSAVHTSKLQVTLNDLFRSWYDLCGRLNDAQYCWRMQSLTIWNSAVNSAGKKWIQFIGIL